MNQLLLSRGSLYDNCFTSSVQLCGYNLKKLTSKIYVFTNLAKNLVFSSFSHVYPGPNISFPIIHAKCDLRAKIPLQGKRRQVCVKCTCVCAHAHTHSWKEHEEFLYSLAYRHRGEKEVRLSKIFNKLHLSHHFPICFRYITIMSACIFALCV